MENLTDNKAVQIDGFNLNTSLYMKICSGNVTVNLCPEAMERVSQSRAVIEERLQDGKSYYGINTGFGALAEVRIEDHKLKELQVNLIRSHACGVGSPLPPQIVRGVLCLRVQTMLRGNSGVRPQTIDLMKEFLNRDIVPIVPSQGSVGACGDLAPLAHIALTLIGEGEVFYKGQICAASQALEQENLKPLEPEAKEGLCLINGTQVMTAVGLNCIAQAEEILRCADVATSLTIDAVKGTVTAFRKEIQRVRPHKHQEVVAGNIRSLLCEDDTILQSHKDCGKVQDPYSLRCVPQVHGAVRNALAHAKETLETEANSSTDNPLVFTETKEVLSGGNFHGAPAAMVMDYLGFALTDLGSISERRIEKLVNPHMSGLPPFLTHESGLNSGHMITHCVAASLTNENKVLSTPASSDSIPTSAEKEDHVSMGMTSALKLAKIVENISHIISIEMIAASEGIEFHAPLKPGKRLEKAYLEVRKYSASMQVDRSLSKDIGVLAEAIRNGHYLESVQLGLS